MSKLTATKQTTGYSQETLFMIEDCMKALNLTTLQRETIMTDLKKGKAVPLSFLNTNTKSQRIRYAPTQSIFLAKRPKKRKRDTMVSSGAYDVPQFVPQPKIDREKEKERLQNICFGMNEIPDDDDEPTQKEVNFNLEAKYFKYERMKELMNEIEERIQFLKEVEELGYKRKYEMDMKNEIAQKVKQLKKLSSLRGIDENRNENCSKSSAEDLTH